MPSLFGFAAKHEKEGLEYHISDHCRFSPSKKFSNVTCISNYILCITLKDISNPEIIRYLWVLPSTNFHTIQIPLEIALNCTTNIFIGSQSWIHFQENSGISFFSSLQSWASSSWMNIYWIFMTRIAIRLWKVLNGHFRTFSKTRDTEGKAMEYHYNFGDGWEHSIWSDMQIIFPTVRASTLKGHMSMRTVADITDRTNSRNSSSTPRVRLIWPEWPGGLSRGYYGFAIYMPSYSHGTEVKRR